MVEIIMPMTGNSIVEIIMPKMGDGMTEGKIIKWLKKVGENVTKGNALLEIETDKANTEIEADGTGLLSRILVQNGETVPVGTVIGVIGGPMEVVSEPPEDIPIVLPPKPGGPPGGNGKRDRSVKASPLVWAMVQEWERAHGKKFDLAQVRGTGPGGRIIQGDLLAHWAAPPPPPPGPDPGAMAKRIAELEQLIAGLNRRLETAGTSGASGLTWQDIPTSKMRLAIANRTVQSKQNTPHFYVTMLIEMDPALALLKELNVDVSEGKVTVNDIIVKACARSLGKVPEVNATWTSENTIRRYAEAHIGVAVGIEDGLIIPVVRDCHKKSLRQISVEAKQLITRARNNQLKPEEYSGGTFSVSNLGMMGVDEFIAIINPPEAAILAIGGIAREPVVVGEGDAVKVEARSRMKVTISADHRLLDGVVAARFLQEVKKALEAPFSLLS